MISKNNKQTKSYGHDEIRAEHRACVDYHTALVNSRFTIIGFYIAALGFLGGTIFKEDVGPEAKLTISFVAIWITSCLWIIELRTRALFTNIAYRGIEIERRYWKLDAMSGFFSRQHKIPINIDAIHNTESRRNNPDRPVLGWNKNPISLKLSRYISHSMGLDLLFSGLLLFWIIIMISSILHIIADYMK